MFITGPMLDPTYTPPPAPAPASHDEAWVAGALGTVIGAGVALALIIAAIRGLF